MSIGLPQKPVSGFYFLVSQFFFYIVEQQTIMPEAPHYAYKYTLSTQDDVRGTWTEELLSYVEKNTLWYALKHEVGENYKLHIHLAFFTLLIHASTRSSAGI